MRVRLTHIDGPLPNLALMKLSHWHKAHGDSVFFTHDINRGLFEDQYDRIYASCIFLFAKHKLDRFLDQWPEATVGGTGSSVVQTVEDVFGQSYEHYDYSIYPSFKWSLGFTSRGCRLHCPFCFVPSKEGRIHPVATILQIYRGGEKCVLLLDNDFFGQPEWKARCQEVIEGKFKVSLNQGINVRLVTDEQAHSLSQMLYYDDQFKVRRIYTAWDNVQDEKRFFGGIEKLKVAGIPMHHILVYMLVGFKENETIQEIMYRFERIKGVGMLPYPMLYNNSQKRDLRRFQRWVVRRYYEFIPWQQYT